MRNIRKYSTDRLISPPLFARLISEILQECSTTKGFRFQGNAIRLMEEAAEDHLIRLFKIANAYAVHAGRVTIFPKDIKLARPPIRHDTSAPAPAS